MILPVRKAYLHWVAEHPETSKRCCDRSHFSIPSWDPLPDDMVCERERAWRQYVRARDGVESYPFVAITRPLVQRMAAR